MNEKDLRHVAEGAAIAAGLIVGFALFPFVWVCGSIVGAYIVAKLFEQVNL